MSLKTYAIQIWNQSFLTWDQLHLTTSKIFLTKTDVLFQEINSIFSKALFCCLTLYILLIRRSRIKKIHSLSKTNKDQVPIPLHILIVIHFIDFKYGGPIEGKAHVDNCSHSVFRCLLCWFPPAPHIFSWSFFWGFFSGNCSLDLSYGVFGAGAA